MISALSPSKRCLLIAQATSLNLPILGTDEQVDGLKSANEKLVYRSFPYGCILDSAHRTWG